MNGLIIVNKDAGFTSLDVVAKLRGIIHQKKIGHTGTLDPDATGVLPILLGSATKLSDIITDEQKQYETTMLLGVTTDTQDMSGQVLQVHKVDVTAEQLQSAVASFVGDIMQIPPMYSALKVGGKKLYELARAGKSVERKPRPIHIGGIEITDVNLPRVSLRVDCSKGTYIRTLCNDIGEKLGCGAAVERLHRTQVGRFCISQAVTLSEIEAAMADGTPDRYVITIEEALSEYPVFTVLAEHEKALRNGNAIHTDWGKASCAADTVLMKTADGETIGLYEVRDDGAFHPMKMLIG